MCACVCEGMYAGESLDWTRRLCESMLHIVGQARYVEGGCYRDRPSVYVGGCVSRVDLGKCRLF